MSRLFRWFAVAFTLQALMSCGLYDVVSLSPPTAGTVSEADYTFSFLATNANDELSFRGFEVYYKIYPQDTAFEGGLYSRDELVNSLHFKRISMNGTGDQPLIFVPADDRGLAFRVVLNFNPAQFGLNPYSQVQEIDLLPTAIENVSLYRGVPDNRVGHDLSDFKPFTEFTFDESRPLNELYSDLDIDAGIWSEILSSNQVKLVLYVFSYGVDTANGWSKVYSVGIYLGDILIRFIAST